MRFDNHRQLIVLAINAARILLNDPDIGNPNAFQIASISIQKEGLP